MCCRYALKSFVIILPLLGLTWLFGILAANPWNRGLSITFSCLFIIFNSLQVSLKNIVTSLKSLLNLINLTLLCFLFLYVYHMQGFSVFLFHVVRHEKNWDKLKRFWVTKCLKRTAEVRVYHEVTCCIYVLYIQYLKWRIVNNHWNY